MNYLLIEWKGKCYPGVSIPVFKGSDKEQIATIATTSMLNEMTDEDGCFLSEEAIKKDQDISWYVQPREIYWPENKLANYVEKLLN